MKKLLTPFILTLLLYGCVTTQTPQSQRYNPNFDYTSRERKQPNSAKLSIALLKPFFVSEDHKTAPAPYSDFLSRMEDDFEEMLIAKGVSLKGPFLSRDDMVYSDKTKSDFALEISIDLVEDGSLKMKNYSISQYYDSYGVSGSYQLRGNLVMQIVDQFDGEKYWKKSIALPSQTVTCKNEKNFKSKPTYADLLKDNGIYNPIAKALESYYRTALETAEKHLEIEEMKIIAQQVKQKQGK